MVKPELGTKRVCPVTGRKFYDLNKDPVISPYTGQVVPITVPVSRGRVEASRAPQVEPDAEVEETEDVELVPLEDADEEAASPAKAAPADDIEIDDEVEADGDDDDTFLEEDEDGDDDVTDLIGDGLEDDEES